jgi:serine/threonine protein kinase
LFEIIQQIKKGQRPPFTPDEIITCITHLAKGTDSSIDLCAHRLLTFLFSSAMMYLHGLPDKVIHRDIKVPLSCDTSSTTPVRP